ncbi:hypothetical protein Desaci_3574 [Desulfosporosinus acidiphilus SJ4]|uniref:Lipoprotein n=1 Tax=Desulfosporosinus acidiphilus (strain DSM 22704 / JCM 16185 / SJ4) TaxID=646529 RepID=I4D9I1_DESAJ|nr:hypothetical protein [Desulfosporosinus acidiphilus]AFM42455.1 hypothetical protein Desaci_3574 [Desulfosporosinus acidiphilus SJ4]
MVKLFKLFKLLLMVFLLLLLGGCTKMSWTTAGKIVPPISNICPLEGKWIVLQDLSAGGQSGRKEENWVGNTAQFTRDVAILGDYVWNSPSYKIKKVNATNYLMTKYLMLPSSLVPDNKIVEVTTVSTSESFLGEFIRINDSKLIALVQNKVLLLQKVSDQADNSLIVMNPNGPNLKQSSKSAISGVLLGLKIPEGNDETYQTLWLAASAKKLHPVLMGPNIFFPRSSGFWVLQAQKVITGALKDDELSAHDISTKILENQSKTMKTNKSVVSEKNQQRIIDYVGNDYVTIENKIDGVDQLQVLPVDKISAQEGVKISDLLENGGSNVYNNARAQVLQALKNEGILPKDNDRSGENFGLARKNGHWYLQGRVNYQYEGSPRYIDYNVNLIPPAKMISYDTLCLSWQNIKDRIPDATDAFTSPNRDIALITTKTELYVYGITNDRLDREPLTDLKLKEGEAVIMSEWATGSYVDNWEKAFLAYGAQRFN